MAVFKARGLVIFRGLKALQFSWLFQPFQWNQLNKNWSTPYLRPPLCTRWSLIFFSNLVAFLKARGLVIFCGLKTLQFSQLFQPFQWNYLNKNWSTPSLRPALWRFVANLIFSEILCILKLRDLSKFAVCLWHQKSIYIKFKKPCGLEKSSPPDVVGIQSVYIIKSAPPPATQPPSLDQS